MTFEQYAEKYDREKEARLQEFIDFREKRFPAADVRLGIQRITDHFDALKRDYLRRKGVSTLWQYRLIHNAPGEEW